MYICFNINVIVHILFALTNFAKRRVHSKAYGNETVVSKPKWSSSTKLHSDITPACIRMLYHSYKADSWSIISCYNTLSQILLISCYVICGNATDARWDEVAVYKEAINGLWILLRNAHIVCLRDNTVVVLQILLTDNRVERHMAYSTEMW